MGMSKNLCVQLFTQMNAVAQFAKLTMLTLMLPWGEVD